MDRRGHEAVAERVHGQEGRHLGRVAEVVAVAAAGEGGARGRLGGDDADLPARRRFSARKGKARPAKLDPPPTQPMITSGSAPAWASCSRASWPDHRLVQQDVVEHAAERVLGVVARGRVLHRLADRDAQAAGAVGVRLQDPAAGSRVGRRARHDLAPPCADHRAPVGLLVVGGPHHVDLALELEQLAGECERRAPLAGAGLGGEPRDPLLAVVEGLGHRRVRLVAARGLHALVLVEDAAGGPERLLQAEGAVERGGPPHRVDLAHGVRDRRPSGRSRPPAGSAPSGRAAPGRPGPPAGPCRGAAAAEAATAGRPRRCTTGGGSRPRRGGNGAGPPGASSL